MQQSESLEKLKVQACQEALSRHDEIVVDTLMGTNKLPVLIHRLITLEAFRHNILPEFFKSDIDDVTAIKLYLILYQETTVFTILLTSFYQLSAIESVMDFLVEICDYCHRRLLTLNSGLSYPDGEHNRSSMELEPVLARLNRQKRTMEFGLCADAISMIRLISDHIDSLPLGLVTRMLNRQDILLSLVTVLDSGVFNRREEGKVEKFSDQEWRPVQGNDQFKLTRLEGNIWIAIYNFTMSPTCRQKFELDEYRLETLLKLKRFFNEILIDQLPMLEGVWRTVEQLSIAGLPNNSWKSSGLLIEQVADIYASTLGLNYSDIAVQLFEKFFKPEHIKSELSQMADFFDEESYSTINKCMNCSRDADKRCSICKKVWYCSRQCQVDAWPNHKTDCRTH
uniref:MYND-type domain-containing protein n=1 Tax=Spongospora subterranea TaxID=70186 RepID=A0A0H5QTV1_9EUKA|eukprot:CRZ05305.1 hypothetical protein [Spongospora subterranea]